jgi:hypothetical protein
MGVHYHFSYNMYIGLIMSLRCGYALASSVRSEIAILDQEFRSLGWYS